MSAHPSTSTSASNGRFAWLDTARGIGIILVVYAHQMRAQAARGLLPASWEGPFQDALIYSFHMPLFFFISGIVSVKAIRQRSFSTNLWDKLQTIAYPYFLWSIVSWCLSTMAVKYVNKPLDIDSLISIAYQPILQFWFLYILFFCQLVAALFGRMIVLNLILVVILLIVAPPFEDNLTIRQFAMSFPFFVAGMFASKRLLSSGRGAVRQPVRSSIVLGVAGAAVALGLLVGLGRIPQSGGGLAIFLKAGCGIVLVVLLARVAGTRLPWLAGLGRDSMAIFVIHTIVAALLRTILAKVGIDDPLVVLLVCVSGGILVPVAVAKTAGQYGLELWLGLGRGGRPSKGPDRAISSTAP